MWTSKSDSQQISQIERKTLCCGWLLNSDWLSVVPASPRSFHWQLSTFLYMKQENGVASSAASCACSQLCNQLCSEFEKCVLLQQQMFKASPLSLR
jgi:hypothetical protein